MVFELNDRVKNDRGQVPVRFGTVVRQPERVARKVNLPLLAWLVLVVVGVVVSLTVLAHMLLELGVAIPFRAFLRVVVVIDVLQVGMTAAETLQYLRHHPVKLCLAIILFWRSLLARHEDCFELVIRKHEQFPDGLTTLVGPFLHG